MMVNNSLFKIKEIPSFHAIAERFERQQFWVEHARNCIEGKWVAGKWMPPELYYYCNFHNIIYESQGGVSTAIGLPWLRDIEWDIFYVFTEACGFSGFTGDDKYTCHEAVNKDNYTKEQIIDYYCRDEKREIVQKHYDNIFNKEGEFKEYIPARNYLRKIHWIDLGKPLYLNDAKNVMILGSRGCGKDLEENTLIHKANGSVKIKDVNIGDKIYGADGKLTTITDKKYFNDQVQYRITLADGRSLIAGEGHLWTVVDTASGRNHKKITIDTATIRDKYKKHIRKKNNGKYDFDARYFIPMNAGYEGIESDLPIDPYFLGLWLGDGSKERIGITTIDDEIKDYTYKYAKDNDLQVNINYNKDKSCPTYIITNGKKRLGKDKNLLLKKFGDLGLINNKHIPDEYFNASFEQRLELLKGIVDSDGHIKSRACEISSSIEPLALNIIKLSRGLGIRTTYSIRTPYYKNKNGEKIYGKKNYRIYLKSKFNIAKLSRKNIEFKGITGNYSNSTYNMVAIRNVEEIGVMPSVCIAVDNKDKLFLAGEDYVVTHNSYIASGLILHNFLFSGTRDYDEFIARRQAGNPFVAQSVVGAIDAKYSNDLLRKVRIAMENMPGKESIINTWGEVDEFPAPFSVNATGSLMSGKNLIAPNGSQISHRSFKDDPLAANGTRPNRVFCEEVGFWSGLEESLGALEATQAAAEHKRLVIFALGTGGLMAGGAALQAQNVFYHPEDYNFLSFDDVWENKGKIGYFISAIYSRNKFKRGENLITDVKEAEVEIAKEIEAAKKSDNSTRLLTQIINNPLKPSEIFLRQEGVFFPVRDLTIVLTDLETNKIKTNSIQKVEFIEEKRGVVGWKYSDKPEIAEFPLTKSYEMDAATCIYEMPRKDNDGNIFDGRYIWGCLPPGEKVMTIDGLKNVEDVSVNDRLINEDGAPVSINTLMSFYKEDEDIFELKSSVTVNSTKFTGEHPILSCIPKQRYVSIGKYKREGLKQKFNEFNFEYIKAKDLTKNHWIRIPNMYKTLKNDFNIEDLWDNTNHRIDRCIDNPLLKDDFWWFIGLFLGYGWCEGDNRIAISLDKKYPEIIDKLKDVIKTIFNRSTESIVDKGGSIEFVFGFQQLNRFLRLHFSEYAHGKVIPEWVKKINNTLKANLILGYLDSDGCVTKSRGLDNIQFVSINTGLLNGIQDILFSIGILSSIKLLRNGRKEFIIDRICNTKDKYSMSLSNYDVRLLCNILSNKLDTKLKYATAFSNRNSRTIKNCMFDKDEDYIYLRIANINISKHTGYVHNFNCETNTYMCHRITTHNCDPVDDDGNADTKHSLQSMIMLDTWTDRIVAEYSARPKMASDFYEQARLFAIFFNARGLHENNKQGLYAHFKNKNSLNLLIETPEILKQQDLVKRVGIGNRALGVNIGNDRIKLFGIQLIQKWLELPAYDNPEVKNLTTLRGRAMLSELIKFYIGLNADRVSALICLMIYREELNDRIRVDHSRKIKTATEDSFWGRAYKGFNANRQINIYNQVK